ncbi:MAG: hypothetical protein H6728_05475 [Myxococcales bacterium]|nr:hypothetical protein [Myxococcales bacterium]MCB9642506.1 hypothetical protein [Myxococcales bacterium]
MLSKRAQKRKRISPQRMLRRPRTFLVPRISDDAPDVEFEQLPYEVRQEIAEGIRQVSAYPEEALEHLAELRQKYPSVPQLYNATAHAYGVLGDLNTQRYWVLKTYELFPRYLFGLCAYGEMLLRREQLDEFEQLFGSKRQLQLLIPEQREFHTTEAIAFYRMWCRYSLQRRSWDVAWDYYDKLCDLDPNHPQVVPLHSIFRREQLHA